MNLDKVFFDPWIGPSYGKKNNVFKGHRIMILGESHYCDKCSNCGEVRLVSKCPNSITNMVMNQIVEGIKSRYSLTFHYFAQAIIGEEDLEEKDIWNSVIFYNYLQKALPYEGAKKDTEDFKKSSPAFFQVINRYEPEIIFTWGAGFLHTNKPTENWIWNPDIETGNDKVKIVRNGYYELDNKKKVRIVFCWHPRAKRGFEPSFWHTVIKSELEKL